MGRERNPFATTRDTTLRVNTLYENLPTPTEKSAAEPSNPKYKIRDTENPANQTSIQEEKDKSTTLRKETASEYKQSVCSEYGDADESSSTDEGSETDSSDYSSALDDDQGDENHEEDDGKNEDDGEYEYDYVDYYHFIAEADDEHEDSDDEDYSPEESDDDEGEESDDNMEEGEESDDNMEE